MNEAFVRYLSDDNKDYILSAFQTSDINNYDIPLTASYNITHKNAVSAFDKDYYIDLDFGKEFGSFLFDTAIRKLDYWFDYKINISRQTELMIPQGYTITNMPAGTDIKNDNYEFKITYSMQPGKLIYNKIIIIKNTWLKKADFAKWNNDIRKLAAAYNEQITLTSK